MAAEPELNKQMRREFSAGALVVRQMRHQWWIAVIEPGTRGEPEDREGVIALPKGNVKLGENPEQAAKREVYEEAGLEADVIAKLGSIKYVYARTWEGRGRISKSVIFYLMKYHSGRIGEVAAEMQHEVRRAYWMPLDQATATLSYKGQRRMAQKALQYLRSNPVN